MTFRFLCFVSLFITSINVYAIDTVLVEIDAANEFNKDITLEKVAENIYTTAFNKIKTLDANTEILLKINYPYNLYEAERTYISFFVLENLKTHKATKSCNIELSNDSKALRFNIDALFESKIKSLKDKIAFLSLEQMGTINLFYELITSFTLLKADYINIKNINSFTAADLYDHFENLETKFTHEQVFLLASLNKLKNYLKANSYETLSHPQQLIIMEFFKLSMYMPKSSSVALNVFKCFFPILNNEQFINLERLYYPDFDRQHLLSKPDFYESDELSSKNPFNLYLEYIKNPDGNDRTLTNDLSMQALLGSLSKQMDYLMMNEYFPKNGNELIIDLSVNGLNEEEYFKLENKIHNYILDHMDKMVYTGKVLYFKAPTFIVNIDRIKYDLNFDIEANKLSKELNYKILDNLKSIDAVEEYINLPVAQTEEKLKPITLTLEALNNLLEKNSFEELSKKTQNKLVITVLSYESFVETFPVRLESLFGKFKKLYENEMFKSMRETASEKYKNTPISKLKVR